MDHLLDAGQDIVSDNVCQAIAKWSNMLCCVNRSVVQKAMLSPANTAAASAGAAALMWAQHSRGKGLWMEMAAE